MVEDAIRSGDLGRASHSIQDRFAPAHINFGLWEGFQALGLWGMIKHIVSDTFPSKASIDGAYEATKNMFEQTKSQAPGKVEVNNSSQTPGSNSGPQGCMAKGGNCW